MVVAGAWQDVCKDVVTSVTVRRVIWQRVTRNVVCARVAIETMQMIGQDVDVLEDIDTAHLYSMLEGLRQDLETIDDFKGTEYSRR